MPLLTVTESEWQQAQDFYRENPGDSYKPKNQRPGHAFIRVQGVIYAIANKDDKNIPSPVVGEGSFGRVKICQAQNGENFVVKIEGIAQQASKDEASKKTMTPLQRRRERKQKKSERLELKINRELGRSLGTSTRKLPFVKPFKDVKQASHKKYSIQKKIPGKNLKDVLDPSSQESLTESQKLLIAIHCTKEVRVLHKKNILHRDIKPENFMVDIQGNHIAVTAIDFGLSAKVKKSLFGKKARSIFSRGSGAFKSLEISNSNLDPELKNVKKNIYTTHSDIFALGVTFKDMIFGMGLQEPKEILSKMTSHQPDQRPRASDILNHLVKTIAKQPDYNQMIPSVAQALYESSPKRFGSPGKIELILKMKHHLELVNALLLSQADKDDPAYADLIELSDKLTNMNIAKYEDKDLELINQNMTMIANMTPEVLKPEVLSKAAEHISEIGEQANMLETYSTSKHAKKLKISTDDFSQKMAAAMPEPPKMPLPRDISELPKAPPPPPPPRTMADVPKAPPPPPPPRRRLPDLPKSSTQTEPNPSESQAPQAQPKKRGSSNLLFQKMQKELEPFFQDKGQSPQPESERSVSESKDKARTSKRN